MEDKTMIETLVKEKEVLESVVKELDAKNAEYEKFGTPGELEDLMKRTEKLVEDYKSLKEAYESLSEHHEKALEKISAYESLGTPEEIDKALDISYNFIEKAESERLSKKYGVSVDVVTEMLKVYESSAKVEGVLGSLLTVKNESKSEPEKISKGIRTLKTLTYGL